MSNVFNDVQSVPQTFSSWDSCMQKAYCKWPVIVGIVIASLIVLSIVWCLASCLCCGATLCGSCVRCLTCFGCCGMCKTGSGGGGGRKTKYRDDYNQMPPTPYNGYQPPPTMPMSYSRAPQATQFAQFDAANKNGKFNGDALPEMPTWANATTRRVLDDSEPPVRNGNDLEMGRMAASSGPARGGYSQVPRNGPNSPMSPGPQQGYFEGQSHPYQSDISAQRMPQESAGYDNGYSAAAAAPMSPAPTYTSHLPPHMIGAAVATDQFTQHAPTPHEYSRQQQQQQQQYSQHDDQHYIQEDHTGSYMSQQAYGGFRKAGPYSPPQSTQYEASDYNSYRPGSISPPPAQHHYQSYEQQPYVQDHSRQNSQGQGDRPPSLLQVGRKPVQGSHREV